MSAEPRNRFIAIPNYPTSNDPFGSDWLVWDSDSDAVMAKGECDNIRLICESLNRDFDTKEAE
jgi:hypothetical protein